MSFYNRLTKLRKQWEKICKETPVGEPVIHFIELYNKEFETMNNYIKVLEEENKDMRKIIKRKK